MVSKLLFRNFQETVQWLLPTTTLPTMCYHSKYLNLLSGKVRI